MTPAATKADEIVLVLEEAILSGELAPGSVLRQEQLSEEFGVSRTPIREALRQLAALGLVSFAPKRGARVRSVSQADLHETFIVRAALEGFAAGLAVERLTKTDLRKLERAEKRFAQLTRALRSSRGRETEIRALAADWVHANEAFHDVFLDAANVRSLAEAARSARRVFHGQAVWPSGSELDELYSLNLEQHREIVEAFVASNSQVRDLVEKHILDSGRLLEQALEQAGYSSRTRFSHRVSWSAAHAVEGSRKVHQFRQTKSPPVGSSVADGAAAQAESRSDGAWVAGTTPTLRARRR